MPLNHTPEFALSFTADAVHLLRLRAAASQGQGWDSLGKVAFASPDFRDELAQLRKDAEAGLASGFDGLPVLLVIPYEQILYTSLDVPAGPQRDRAVGQALDGLTPYTIDELAFDWIEEGAGVRVAAVARQTLHEAMEFAQRHGFTSAGYSALPDAEDYPGMPIFLLDPVEDGADDEESAPVAEADLLDPLPEAEVVSEEEAAPLVRATDEAEAEVDEDSFADRPAQQPDMDIGADDALGEDHLQSGFSMRKDAGDDLVAEAQTTEAEAPAEAGLADFQRSQPFPDVALPKPEGDQASALSTGQGPDSLPEDAGNTEPDPAQVIESAPDEGGPEPVTAMTPPKAAAPVAPPIAPKDRRKDRKAQKKKAKLAASRATAPMSSQEKPQDKPQNTPASRPVSAAGSPPTVVRHGAPSVGAAAPSGRVKPAAPQRDRGTGQRGGLLGLVAMLAALIVGLLLVWAFFVPSDHPAQQMGQDIALTSPEAQPAATAADETPVPSVTPAPTAQDDPVEATTDADKPAEPAAGVVADTQSATPDNAASDNSGAVEGGGTAVTAAPALSEVERALAVAASTAAVEAISAPAPSQPDEAEIAAAQAAATAEAARLAREAEARDAEEKARMAAALALAEEQARTAADQLTTGRVATEAAAPAVTPAPRATGLTRSARPASAPRRPARAPAADTPPAIPSNPLPFEAAQRPVVPKTSSRPPSRPAVARPAPAAAQPQAPARPQAPASVPTPPPPPAPAAARPEAPREAAPVATSNLRSSSRPPARPEGAAPDDLANQPLTASEQQQIREMLKDFHDRQRVLPDLTDRQAAFTAVMEPYRLADLRPARRPASIEARAQQGGGSAESTRDVSEAAPPDRPAQSPVKSSSPTMPARESGGLLNISARPVSRPANRLGTQATAVDAALSEAVSSAAALPQALPGGADGLTKLTSSRLPPRRSAAAAASAAAAEGGAVASLAAAPARNEEAEQAERRRLDEQLQSQAEARIRARAAADAAAEAKARADAEARARAQVAAEERAAAARKQAYRPQEVDDEPEIAQKATRGGATTATVASAATEKRGLNMGRTTIIGIIGAGQASRALIRLRNGKIVTVRLGDKIDGGTITAIGDSKVTYVKSGRPHELRMLDGR